MKGSAASILVSGSVFKAAFEGDVAVKAEMLSICTDFTAKKMIMGWIDGGMRQPFEFSCATINLIAYRDVSPAVMARSMTYHQNDLNFDTLADGGRLLVRRG